MEVHTGENCIDIDNVMSDIPSENGVMRNGTHKSATLSNDAISISESVIARNNLHIAKKENDQTNMYTTLEKSYLPVTLIIMMFIIVMILQIPTVLYYTDPPSAESMLYENINLETCSVS